MKDHIHDTANSLKAREITADKNKSSSSETQKNTVFLKDFFEYAVPLSTVFLAISGVGFYTTFTSLYFEDLGYNKISIGIIQAAYFLGLLLGAWKCEQFVRRVGHIQVLAASGSFLAATTLVQALTTALAPWIVTRIFSGVATAAFYVVIECWMLDHAEHHQRGRFLSLYMITLNTGYAFGQLILHHIDLASVDAFIIASLLYSLSVLPIALSTRKLTTPDSEHGIRVGYLVKTSPFGTTSCLVAGLSISALYSFLVLIPNGTGLQESDGSLLVASMIVGGLLAQWPIGKCSDAFDRRRVLLTLCVCMLITYTIALWIDPASMNLLYLVAFCIGAEVYTLYPLSVTQVIDHLRAQHLTAAMGRLLLIYSLGSVLGPIVASLMIQSQGELGLFRYLLGVTSLAVVTGIHSTLRKKPVPGDEQEDFVALPRTTSLAYELDPRVEGEYDERKG